MHKILYISYDGMTDPLGRSQVVPYLTGLSALGYSITVLSFEKKARLKQDKEFVAQNLSGAGIAWVPCLFTSEPPVLSKAWDRLRMRRTALRLCREQGFDLIHCRSYVAAEVGLALKQKYGVPFIFDMRGFWPDEKVDNGQWRQCSIFYRSLYRYYKQKEQQLLLGAAFVVCLTQAAKNILRASHFYHKLRIAVIPCCADLAHFDSSKTDHFYVEALRRQLGFLPHHKVLVYLGSMGGWYMTREMFCFYRLLQQKDSAYRMLVLTPDDAVTVKSEAIDAGIDPSCLVVTYASREQLPSYLALCAASVFFIRPSYSKQASSPTKHAELMAMGLPVICNDIGDTASILHATGSGYVVKDFSEASLRQAVAEMPHLEQLDPGSIRSGACTYFDLETGVKRYQALYQFILEKPDTRE